MRLTSIYVADCHVCGKSIESPTPEATCSGCGITVTLEWPSRAAGSSREKTVSEKYDKAEVTSARSNR
jgi:hypothetical protein